MRSKIARIGIVGLAAVALCLMGVAAAAASTHVTTQTASSPTLSASLVSTGDAGWNHGNENDAMSPVFPAPAKGFGGWFNQSVTFGGPVITDLDFDGDVALHGSFYKFSTNNVTWSANTAFVNSATVSAEGLYSIIATGVDDAQDPDDALPTTGTIPVAFGIDKTKPVSTSDVKPYYAAMATVTISATDTLAGVENLQTSVDGGPWDWENDADPGMMFTVPVTFGPGTHTLSWHAFDNAGNIDSHSVSFVVRPLGFVPTVHLGVTRYSTGKVDHHTEYHKEKFAGTVSPIASTMSVTLTVQRWSTSSKSWKAYNSFTTSVPMYTSAYSVTKMIPADGKFRVIASFDGGMSDYHTFHTN
jgi:hypothetical protein